MFTIARNRLIDWRRREARQRSVAISPEILGERPAADDPAGLGPGPMAGRQLRNTGEERARRWHGEERQIVVDGLRVDLGANLGMGEQCLDLRREQELAADRGVVEGFDTDPVAREEQPLPAVVPQAEGEHADELGKAVDTPFLVQVHDRLRIGPRAVVVAALEAMAEVGMVVDLAVVGDPHGAVFVRHRLHTRVADVDDAQAAVAEHDPPVGRAPHAGVVGPAVRQRVAHPHEHVDVGLRKWGRGHDPDDAAHCRATRARRPKDFGRCSLPRAASFASTRGRARRRHPRP